ncbi:hypothetical protein SERLADRAFT_393321, partial [Serpula lacrymans var. lacrymans S7.9]
MLVVYQRYYPVFLWLHRKWSNYHKQYSVFRKAGDKVRRAASQILLDNSRFWHCIVFSPESDPLDVL